VVWSQLNNGESLRRQLEVPQWQETISWRSRLYWLAAAFVPSALMLAVTNHMLLNLASVPFLWVMPLAAYLVTFMIAFARRFHVSPALLSRFVPIVLLVLFPIVTATRSVSANRVWYLL